MTFGAVSDCAVRVAVDIGGTFTDVVMHGGDAQVTTKVLTTPAEPAAGMVPRGRR